MSIYFLTSIPFMFFPLFNHYWELAQHFIFLQSFIAFSFWERRIYIFIFIYLDRWFRSKIFYIVFIRCRSLIFCGFLFLFIFQTRYRIFKTFFWSSVICPVWNNISLLNLILFLTLHSFSIKYFVKVDQFWSVD